MLVRGGGSELVLRGGGRCWWKLVAGGDGVGLQWKVVVVASGDENWL